MKQGHFEEHWTDENGNPAGGVSSGRGIAISWQNGPLGLHGPDCFESEGTVFGYGCVDKTCTRRPPNGAFVEDLIAIVVGRLEFYEESEFACAANRAAIKALNAAAVVLDQRTKDREARKVEGTHKA